MDKDWFEEEMSLQEDVADFIRQSYYHNNHPNEFRHLAWAIYIAKQAGWANV
jgi:homogentisate 1,2-dioxygenase